MKEIQLNAETKPETKELVSESLENAKIEKGKEKLFSDLNLSEILSTLKEFQKNKAVYEIKGEVNQLSEAAKNIFEAKKLVALQDYLSKGGVEEDFFFEDKLYSDFKTEFAEYKRKLKKHFEEKRLSEEKNLKAKQLIVEELKNLYSTPIEDNKLLFEKYKELKTKWNEVGNIPKTSVEEIYKNYHHHLDNFFDFLDINKDLRDAYFQKNLEVRKSILEKTEQLLEETNAKEILRKLRFLHQSWKHEAVPVAKEHREETWNTFLELSKKAREKADDILKNLEKEAEERLKEKKEILEALTTELEKEIPEKQRDRNLYFDTINQKIEKFKTIETPKNKENKELWASFRKLNNLYYSKKNTYYKNLKKETNQNIQKKKELILIAKEHQESTDWENSLQILKTIQNQWKNVGFVPSKISNDLWKEFKSSCDVFFERLKNKNNQTKKEENEELDAKKRILEKLKNPDIENTNWEEVAREWYKSSSSSGLDLEFENLLGNLSLKNKKIQDVVENVKSEVLSSRQATEKDLQWIEQEIAKSENLKKSYQKELNQSENSLAMFSAKSKENPMLTNLKKQIEKNKLLIEKEISYQKELRTKLRELREKNSEEFVEKENA